MKFQLSSIKLKPLGNRGISHLMVPLLIVLTIAVGGTFMMVSSKAATPNPGGAPAPAESASGKKAKKPKIDPNTTKLLIYSAKGSFKSVKIVSSSKEGKTVAAKCAQSPNEVGGKIKKTPNLKKNKFNLSIKASIDKETKKSVYLPTRIICQDPVGESSSKATGEAFLKVIYSKSKKTKAKFNGAPVLIAGHAKECVFVHYTGVTDRARVPFTDGTCVKVVGASASGVEQGETDEAPEPTNPIYQAAD